MNPTRQTKDQLISALRSIADSIEKNDSFEGSIEYTAAEFEVFDVRASWRVGNSEGQGGSILIGKIPAA